MEFIWQILRHTPVWVYGIFALLVYLGAIQTRERRVSRLRVAILPIVMLAFSLLGVLGTFGLSALTLGAWTGGILLVVILNQIARFPRGVRHPAGSSHFVIPGSWTPLLLMLAIFFARYVVAVTAVMRPALGANSTYVVVVAAGFGLFSGIFLARALQIWGTKPDIAAASISAPKEGAAITPLTSRG